MPLFREVNGEFVQWLGEPINDIPYGFEIEDKWSYESLASIGLYRPQEPEPAPPGYEIVSTKPEWAPDGYVRYIHELVLVDPQPITRGQVNQESLRRIEAGFEFNGKMFDNDPLSNRRIIGAGALAIAAIMNGATPGDYFWRDDTNTEPFQWIVQDNSKMSLDAYQVLDLGKAAAEWEQSHVFSADTLKNMDPIPLDYTDDQYWP